MFEQLGRLLKSARKENNLTMGDVARTISKSVSFVNNVESGRNKPPAELISRWSTKVGLDPTDLSRKYLKQEANQFAKKAGLNATFEIKTKR